MASAQGDIPRVLSIAGSDSGGGAGIQADLKAFARCGVHGMTAVTAITAQNTVAVSAVYPLPPEVIVAQVRAVVEDIGVDAVEIGMLGNTQTIAAGGRGPRPGRRPPAPAGPARGGAPGQGAGNGGRARRLARHRRGGGAGGRVRAGPRRRRGRRLSAVPPG